MSIDYVLNENLVNKQFYYDGDRLTMDINLGTITYTNVSDGAKEIYEAYKIEIHYPSEHYVTIEGITPRYEIEMQIFHNIVKTNNPIVTNMQVKVNRAIISILFTLSHQDLGDTFFNNLGISKYNLNQYGQMNIPKPKENITYSRPLPASFGSGFNYNTFQSLLNLLNADPGIFYYYGSEAAPPCREDVLWMVFSQPRSIGDIQVDFIKKLLAKTNTNLDLKDKTMNENARLFGNNRRIVVNKIFNY